MDELTISNISSGNTALYTAAAADGTWFAFLLDQGVSCPENTITISQTVKYQGYYLFATTAPTGDINTFVTNCWSYLIPLKVTYQYSAIVWMTNPQGPFNTANTLQLVLSFSGGLQFQVLKPLNFNFGYNYASLYISNSTNLVIDPVNNRFDFQIDPNYSFIKLQTNTVQSNSQVRSDLLVPMTGIGKGCMRFQAYLSTATDYNTGNFNFALKYFFPDSVSGQISEINASLLIPGNQNDFDIYQCSLYPPDMLNSAGNYTYFAPTGQSWNSNTKLTTATVMAASFMTDYGYPLNLIPVVSWDAAYLPDTYPVTGSTLMIFSPRCPSDPNSRWYLLPEGNYRIGIAEAYVPYLDGKNQLRFLCGLAGTESISFTPQTSKTTGDLISFIPGQAAQATQFPIVPTDNVVGSNTGKTGLVNTYITSWAGFAAGLQTNQPIIYHAQPQGSSLFAQKQDVFNSDVLLGYQILNAGTLSTGNEVSYFPIAAYGQSLTAPADFDPMQFEQQILNPSRKSEIAESQKAEAEMLTAKRRTNQRLLHSEANENIIKTTSNQGFYIEVDQDTSVWDTLKMAVNDDLQGLNSVLSFDALSAKLQSVFQSNQLFLVVSANKDGVLGTFNSEMTIEGWPFHINIPAANPTGQYKNVLLFKYCDGALIDLSKNIQNWSDPSSFTDTSADGLSNVSLWLQQYLQSGIDKYAINNDTDYYKFHKVATDPSWKGILALNVDIDVQNFPADLQGLLAGIDMSKFAAHHFGVDSSYIDQKDGELKMQNPSSLFALIDYEDTVYQQLGYSIEAYKKRAPINTAVDYTFTVITLKVLFENTQITNFNSYLAFTVNKLFDEKINSINRQNLIILTGTYEDQNGIAAYTFNTMDDIILVMESAVFNTIEIVKASFNTIVPQQADSTDEVDSTFSFWGYLNLKSLSGFDLLSFGSENNTLSSGYGAYYSSMCVDLSFPLNTPTIQTFSFDIGQLSFDTGQSVARTDSLYAHFPLQLTGMSYGDASNSPSSQGYMSVLVEGLAAQAAVSGRWYGLTFTLNMGSMGALASSAGFNSIFMTCWSPGQQGAAAMIKLSGVNPQAPAFSLQGVINIGIGVITLQNISAMGKTPSYMMQINNIVLKLLGLSFPAGGNINFYLFGNPDVSGAPQSLGWYANYAEKS
ncbi:hypothetical protein HDF26_002100 [Pedobacter cryoconitis]|uniref:hypothetical protein n=1 Tax=Pedobacter cryoconitis TaxID=188932 RepID=UPI00160CF076|nr:hypothetical protein [Pedobacter cryoconitis]MBB6271643.1 hypothetical protein [Pedobacter cryoconitis]